MSQQLTDNQLLHRQYLQSPIWKAKRQEALAHYGTICARCKEHGTDVHHKTYERVGGAELMEDLEVVCRECHDAHHRAEKATRHKRATREPRSINRRAIFQYLTTTQKDKLVKDFGLDNRNDLSFRLGQTRDNHIAVNAARMLGFDCFNGHIGDKRKKERAPKAIPPPLPLGALCPRTRYNRPDRPCVPSFLTPATFIASVM